MKGNSVEKMTNATAYRQADLQIPATVYSVTEVREKKGRVTMQTRRGKRAAFFTVFLMLSACGGGGGGTVATPAPAAVPTTAFTTWRTDLAGKTIKADGRGKQVAYTWNGTNISGITPVDEATSSATFSFDATSNLAGLIIDSSTNTSTTTAVFVGSQLKVLARDADFTTAASASSQAVFSNPKSLAWDYQSFGVWETGLDNPAGGNYGAMSVGAPTAGSAIDTVGSATFTGKVVGSYVSPAGLGHTALAGLTVVADFGNHSLDFSTTNTVISSNWSSFDAAPGLDLTGTLTYTAGTNSFTGTLSTTTPNPSGDGGVLSGNSTGQFYGPAGEELGGVFFLNAGSGNESYSGAYGAVQSPAP